MTEYDYSPEAWEAHLAKQARIAEWSAQASTVNGPNPFKPTEEEIARLKASGFYNADRKRYTGPDRPPSPGAPPTSSQGGYQYPSPSASGSTSPSLAYSAGQQTIVIPRGHVAHVPIYNPATRQYEWKKFENPTSSKSKGHHSKSSSPSRSTTTTRRQPTRSATMPVGYTYAGQQQPGQQQSAQYVYPYPYPQQPPNSGSTVASQTSGNMGYASYPAVIVDGATARKPKKLQKAKEV